MKSDYIPAALTILVGVGFALLLTAAAKYLGPHRPNKAKDYPFECGSEPIGSPARALLGEVLPGRDPLPGVRHRSPRSCTRGRSLSQAVLHRRRSTASVCTAGITFFGLAEMLVFLAILVVALAYVWRKKAIGWE